VVGEWIKSIAKLWHWYAENGNGKEMNVWWKSLMEHQCDQQENFYHTLDL